MLRLLATLVAVVAAVPAAVPGARAQSLEWRPDERVVISAFHDVGAVARDESRLYVATPRGMEIYDFIAGRWELPSTMEDGYPAHREVTALAFEPLERTVWLATRRGELHAYRVDFRRWEARGAPAAGPVARIVPASADEGAVLFLRTPGGWYRMSAFSGVSRRVPPGSLPEAVAREEGSAGRRLAREDPFYRSARGTLTLDRALRDWPVTDWVADARPHRYWLGTRGGNVWLYDSRRMTAEPRTFGLVSPGTRALAAEAGGVWHGGDGSGPRTGVSWGSDDLQRWRHHEAALEDAPPGPVFEIEVAGGLAWFAAGDGLYAHREDGGWLRLPGSGGLPSGRVLAVEPDGTGSVWAGTDRGLARVRPGAGSERPGVAVEETLFRGREVRALQAVDGGVWVGLRDAPYFIPDGGGPGLPDDSSGSAPPAEIVDFAVAAGALWAATPRALWRWDGAAWRGPLRAVSTGGVGRILRIRADGDALWVAGAGGAARRDPESGAWLHLAAGATIPGGPVTDVLPSGERVWVATPEGSVRIDWTRAR